MTRWVYSEKDDEAVKRLLSDINISPLAAYALVTRGICNLEETYSFIENDRGLPDPNIMKDMDIAVERIDKAIDSRECIAVFGDYDVDGIMSAVMVYSYLDSLGANVRVLIPERESSGYGLAKSSVDEIADIGATLIITVDNGVSSHQAVDYANELGIDTVICDHHIVPKTLPNALAVVDPLREDDQSTFKKLAGVGVALGLISAIEGSPVEDMMEMFGDLAAIGTIADVVPLIEDNRYIVSVGLTQVRSTTNLGLMALIEQTGLAFETLSIQDIIYTIIPRLNAAGRMASASLSLEMLITEDYEQANEIASKLSSLNALRQKVEGDMFGRICSIIDGDMNYCHDPVLIMASTEYSSGVSGIVCSKLTDRYSKPAIVISQEDDIAKGSGRSIEGFSLYDAIDYASSYLISFGGHEMAAGFTLYTKDIDHFKQKILEYCQQLQEFSLIRTLNICADIDFRQINEENVVSLQLLAPFGMSNEEPVFSSCSVIIKDIVPLAEKHSRITFEQNQKILKSALFQTTPEQFNFSVGDRVDIAYTLSIYNASNGMSYISSRLKGIVPAGLHKEDYLSVVSINNLCFGREIGSKQREEVSLTREDIALVYRSLKGGSVFDSNEYIAFHFYNSMIPGKAIAAVMVLKELNIVTNSSGKLVVTDDSKKKELHNSKVFSVLGR